MGTVPEIDRRTTGDRKAIGDARLEVFAEMRIAHEQQITSKLQAMSLRELYDLREACERYARGCHGFKPWTAALVETIDGEIGYHYRSVQMRESGLDVYPPVGLIED